MFSTQIEKILNDAIETASLYTQSNPMEAVIIGVVGLMAVVTLFTKWTS